MTETIKAIILGIVQGLTEFLPVSSSGHLKIFSQFGHDSLQNNVGFDVVVHFATLLAVMIVFRKRYLDLIKESYTSFHDKKFSLKRAYQECHQFRTAVFVILASIPTAIIGLSFKDYFESRSILTVGICLIATSAILYLPHLTKRKNIEPINLNWKFALLLGVAQSFAILPGISRSGTTISIALLLGASRSFSGYFSFLIMIPAVAGATLLNITEIASIAPTLLISGFLASFISGIVALLFLLKLLDKGKFHYFSPYCFLLGLGTLIYHFL